MKRTYYLLAYLLPILLLIGLVILHYYNQQHDASTTENTPLPYFTVTNLLDTSKTFTQDDLKGQVCLLNVWASWCAPCQREYKVLLEITRHYAIPLYGLNFRERPQMAKAFLEKFGNPFILVGMDSNGQAAAQFGIAGIPQTLLIDKHGIIRYRHIGALTQSNWEDVLLPLVRKYMAE